MSPSSSPSLLRVAVALAAVYVIWGSTYLAIAVAVAVTVSVKSASLSAGGVTVRPASCAGVSVHEPSPFFRRNRVSTLRPLNENSFPGAIRWSSIRRETSATLWRRSRLDPPYNRRVLGVKSRRILRLCRAS